MKDYKTITFLFICTLLFPILTFGQETKKLPQAITPSNKAIDNDVYIITDVKYVIKGLVLKSALEEKLRFATGTKKFYSRETFINYLEDKTAKLKNINQIENISTITYDYTWNKEKHQFEIILTIFVFAKNTFLIIPYPKYSDNTGFELSLKGKDENFIGSLELLHFNLNYTLDSSNRNGMNTGVGFRYPLQYKENHIFKPGIEESLSYREDNSLQNISGLLFTYSYLINHIAVNLNTNQKFITTTDTGQSSKPKYTRSRTELSLAPSFTLNKNIIPIISSFIYNTSLYTNIETAITPNDPKPQDRYKLDTGFTHSLDFGRIDWIENFRMGVFISIGNKNNYSFKDRGWINSIYLETKFHVAIKGFMGINTRFYVIHNFITYAEPKKGNDKGTSIGNRIRGVLDNNFTNANTGLAINTEVMFKLFRIPYIAQFQGGLFFDVGVRKRVNTDFNVYNDVKYTAGIQGIAFQIFNTSINMRLTYGIDIGRAIKEHRLSFSNREIVFATSLFY